MSIKSDNSDLLSETGVAVEHLADVNLKDNPLYELHQAIAAMPDIDAAKVAAVIRKLQDGKLDLLGDSAQRAAAQSRIAARIIDETLGSGNKAKD